MAIQFIRATAVCLAMTLVSACASGAQVSRGTIFQELGTTRTLTELSREFFAETPYLVNFAFDRYNLDDTATTRLDEQAAWIIAHPNVRFSVYGHTDLMGSNAYNIVLGMNRAQMVVDYFVSKGISASRLEVAETFGEEMPLLNVVAPAEINRRAVTYVAGFVQVASVRDTSSITDITAPATNISPVTDEVCEVDCGDDGGDICEVDCGDDGDDTCEVDCGDDGDDRERLDSGRGNGDETGDPGKSEGKNQGGDEVEGGWVKPGVDNKPTRPARLDSGRGNGDETGDPGNSQGKNQGGDEVG